MRSESEILGDVCGEAVNAALGEVFAALLAGMGIPVAVVVELGPALEVLEDEGVRFAAHCAAWQQGPSNQPAGSEMGTAR